MEYLERLAKIRAEKYQLLVGICKAADLKREITFRWYGIGKEWETDATDTELFSAN